MRHYEAMYIIDADTPEEEIGGVIEKYKKVVTDAGGEVSDASPWDKGRRPLAYPLRHEHKLKTEGFYILMQFTAQEAVPKELDRIFKINDEVMRHLVVRTDPDEE